MKCILCGKKLSGKQTKYCSDHSFEDKWKAYNQKEEVKERKKRWRKNNPEKYEKKLTAARIRRKNERLKKNLKCLICKKELVGLQTRFCSAICSSKWFRRNKREKENLRCLVCGKELPPYHTKYCSKICKNKDVWRKIRKKKNPKCVICGKELPARHVKYCSKECKNNNPIRKERQKIAVKRYRKKNPIKMKNLVLLNCFKRRLRKHKIHHLYDYKCARCGFDKILDIHHINENGKEDRQFKKNIKEYIVLCPNCHAMVTRGYLTKQDILQYQK